MEEDPELYVHDIRHPRFDICASCEGEATWICPLCDSPSCGSCWDTNHIHGPGYQSPHLHKVSREVYLRIRKTLYSRTKDKAALHRSESGAKWFGVVRDSSDRVLFGTTTRLATVIAESYTPECPKKFPSIVSFLGQTGAGKSAIINMLIALQMSRVGKKGDGLVPVPGEPMSAFPTTSDVQLFSDPRTYDRTVPILFADSQGLDGGDRLPTGFRPDPTIPSRIERHGRLKPVPEYVNRIEDITQGVFPNLLHALSDTVVYVTKNHRAIEAQICNHLLPWAQATSSGRHVKPHVIIIINADDGIGVEEWETHHTTRTVLEYLDKDPKLEYYPALQNVADRLHIDTIGGLLEHFYASTTIIRIPKAPFYARMDEQVNKLYNLIAEKSTQSYDQKSQASPYVNEEILARLNALDWFDEIVDSPFDFSTDLCQCIDGGRNAELTWKILHAIIVAARPLTLDELDYVVSDPSCLGSVQRVVEEDCQGFLVRDNEGIVKFSHPAVAAFLRAAPWSTGTPDERDQQWHKFLGERCIKSILEIGTPTGDAPSFFEYAAVNWAGHIRRCGQGQKEYRDDILKLCEAPDSWFPRYWEATNPSAPLPDNFDNLTIAAHVGLEDAIRAILLDSQYPDVKVRKVDKTGRTALHIASANGHIDAVSALIPFLRGTAHLNAADGGGATALHYAAQNGHAELVDFLIRSGADLDVRDIGGRTPLHCAVEGDQCAAATILVLAGANISAQDHDYRTPLHYAALRGGEETLRALLKGKVDLEMVDKDFNTPKMLAEKASGDTDWGRMEQERRIAVFELLETAEFTSLGLANDLDPGTADADQLFHVEETAVAGSFEIPRRTVYEYLQLKDVASQLETRGVVTWLHIPANNMVWVELLMKQCLGPDETRTRDSILNKELWTQGQYRGSAGPHATFMKPLFQSLYVGGQRKVEWGSGEPQYANAVWPYVTPVCLYMPYIHWETMGEFFQISEFIRTLAEKRNAGPPKEKNQLLLYRYLENNHPLHSRRTLDQYRYYNLKDTTDRDKDQVISRDFGRQWPAKPMRERPMLMVDQLWLWILPNGTVITSFPSRWSHGKPGDPEPAGRTDVYKNIKRRIHGVKTSKDVLITVVNECIRSCFDPSRHLNRIPNITETYENEIGRIADQEAALFKVFSQDISNLNDSTPREKSVNMVSFAPEMALLREIKDIRDELSTMGALFLDQIKVLETMYDGNEYQATRRDGLHFVQDIYGETRVMDKRAETTSEALNALIDLKQKFSNVLEARWARNMAEETSRQGTTLMVFTAVTIVFLPLSFMAAIFSVDIAEFPKTDAGMDLSFVMEYIFSISAAVVVPLLFVAFNASRIGRLHRSFTQSIRGRSRLTPHQPPTSPEVESASLPRESLGEAGEIKELKAVDIIMDTTLAGDDHREEEGKAKLSMPILLVLYLFFIQPITEIRFACSLVPVLHKGGFRTDRVSRRNIVNKKDTESETESNSKRKWRLRHGLRAFFVFTFGLLRLLLLPMWCCILCVGVLVALVFYGVISLVLEHNPLDGLVRDIRKSTLLKF